MAQRYKISSEEERWEIFRVDIQLYKHGSQPMRVQNLQILYWVIKKGNGTSKVRTSLFNIQKSFFHHRKDLTLCKRANIQLHARFASTSKQVPNGFKSYQWLPKCSRRYGE